MSDRASRIKIGIVALISSVLFVFMVLSISGLSFTAEREIRVDFSFINSLEVHAPVRFAGARVGEVKRIHVLTPDERNEFPENPPYVYVYASVDKSIKIPKGTKALVNTMGFMGEKYLELMPGSRSTTYVEEGEPLEGVDPTPMDSVFASAKKLADEMEIAARNINTLTTEMQNRLPVLIAEFEKTLASAQDLTGDAKKLTGDVQRSLPNLIIEFEKTLASVQDLTLDAKKISGDAQKTLASVRELSENATSFIVTNRKDLDHLIANGRQITIYMKSLSHILAQRPWKIVWGLGGPIPIEPESEKFVAPPNETTNTVSSVSAPNE